MILKSLIKIIIGDLDHLKDQDHQYRDRRQDVVQEMEGK